MSAQRRISKRLQEKAAAANPLPPPSVLSTTEYPPTNVYNTKAPKHARVSQPISTAKSAPHCAPHTRVRITFTSGGRVLSRAAPPSAAAPMTHSSVAIRNHSTSASNNQMQTPTCVLHLNRLKELREELHDIRRRLNPSLPSLNEMPPESPITLEELRERLQELRRENERDRLRNERDRAQMQRRYEFDRNYYDIRDRVGTSSRMIARRVTVVHGKMYKVDEVHRSLGGLRTSKMGYLSTKRGRAMGRDRPAKPGECVII